MTPSVLLRYLHAGRICTNKTKLASDIRLGKSSASSYEQIGVLSVIEHIRRQGISECRVSSVFYCRNLCYDKAFRSKPEVACCSGQGYQFQCIVISKYLFSHWRSCMARNHMVIWSLSPVLCIRVYNCAGIWWRASNRWIFKIERLNKHSTDY